MARQCTRRASRAIEEQSPRQQGHGIGGLRGRSAVSGGPALCAALRAAAVLASGHGARPARSAAGFSAPRCAANHSLVSAGRGWLINQAPSRRGWFPRLAITSLFNHANQPIDYNCNRLKRPDLCQPTNDDPLLPRGGCRGNLVPVCPRERGATSSVRSAHGCGWAWVGLGRHRVGPGRRGASRLRPCGARAS